MYSASFVLPGERYLWRRDEVKLVPLIYASAWIKPQTAVADGQHTRPTVDKWKRRYVGSTVFKWLESSSNNKKVTGQTPEISKAGCVS